MESINFIQQQNDRRSGMLDQFKHLFIGGTKAIRGVNQQQDEIARLKRGVNFLHHFAVERLSGLCTPGVSMKTIWPPGRLPFGLTLRMPWIFMRVVCGFSVTMAIFSPTSVEQRAFTGVGPADNRYKT